MATWQETDPLSQPTRNLIYAKVDTGNGFTYAPVAGTLNSDGLVTLMTNATSGGSSTSNTVAPTNAGTSATTANPVQGVNGGVPLPSVLTAGTAAIGSITNTAFSISGSLPAFASTPTVNVGTFPALSAGSAAIGTVGVTSLPSLASGNNAIGQVGGKTATIAVTPTVSTTAYSNGNVVGGILTFANALLAAQSGMVQNVSLRIKSVQTVGFKLHLFTANPSSSTFTDKAAPAINAADVFSEVDPIPLSAADSSLGTHTIYVFDGVGRAVNAASTSLYGVLVTTGTPTFASTSDISILITVLQD